MKENFFIKIESLHVADKGVLDNVSWSQNKKFLVLLCIYKEKFQFDFSIGSHSIWTKSNWTSEKLFT